MTIIVYGHTQIGIIRKGITYTIYIHPYIYTHTYNTYAYMYVVWRIVCSQEVQAKTLGIPVPKAGYAYDIYIITHISQAYL